VYDSPEPVTRRTGPGLLLVTVALVAALLGGGIGGAIGALGARGGAGAGDGTGNALDAPLPALGDVTSGGLQAVAARVLPSVVQLRVEGGGAQGEGSGMVLSSDGLVLTNNHVVEAAASGGTVTVLFADGDIRPAEIVGRDPSSDVAVVQAQDVSGLQPVELGDSDTVQVGQHVVAFGAPLGLGGTVTTGIVSAVDRAVSVGGAVVTAGSTTVLNALQTDAAINPGNSGGPLVDMRGRVVGVNSAIATTGAEGGSIGVGFSIPVNQARRIATELQDTGRAARAQLGVQVRDATDPRRTAAYIESVVPGSPAEEAGIVAGDLVLRFDDQRIATGTDLQAAVGSRAPGETVRVELGDRAVEVVLQEAPPG
jgi:putative serine protease PepD